MNSIRFALLLLAVLAGLSSTLVAQERLGDPGFELSTPNGSFPTSGYWTSAWLVEAGARCTTTAGRSGNGLWAYTGPPGDSWWSGTYQQFSVAEGRVYQASAWLRTPFGYPWVAGSRALVRFLFLTSSGAVLATYETAPLLDANSGWTPLSLTSPPAPADAAWGRIVLYIDKPAGTVGQGVVNFDDVSVVEIAPPPTITLPPVSQTVPEGAEVTFRVEAAGVGPFTYRWYFDGAEIPGATADSLTLAAVTTTQSGVYAVEVLNAGGASPRSEATLTVVPVTHPIRLSVSPPQNALAAGRNVVVSATFDQSMDPSSAAGLVVHASRQGRLLAPPGTARVDGPVVSFTGATAFSPGDVVEATLTQELRSAMGGTFNTPFVWQIRVPSAPAAGLFVDSGQRFGSAPLLAGLFLRSMDLGDLDGDGDLDLFGVFLDIGSFATELRVWFNTGGQFQDSGQVLQAFAGGHVQLADFDNDGDLDAFVSHMWGCNLWRNDGSGWFEASGQPLAIDFAAGAAVGDLDGDGDIDIYLPCSGGQSPRPDRVLFNDGHGVFTDSGQLLGYSYSSKAAVSDLDQDGDLDVVVACTEPTERVWINDGTGHFTASGQAVGGTPAPGVVAADFNGDGRTDVALLTGANGSVIELWLNEGQARFHSTGQALVFETSLATLSTGDLDGDGRLDLFTTDTWRGQNRVWLGRGDGTFTTRAQRVGPTVDLGSGPRSAALGDLEGDGDLDVVLGFESKPLQSWANTGTSPTLSLTLVPPFGSTLNLTGRVQGLVDPTAFRIATVIFIPGLGYYSKPYCDPRLTPILADGTFSIDITTGGVDATATLVICWVVSPDVALPCLTGADCIPGEFDEASWARATATRADPGQRVIRFSGLDWLVKGNTVRLGPGPNYFSASEENVWVDTEGRLHLKITYREGRWYCAEVVCLTPLGYGEYRTEVDSSLLLDPGVVFGMFTWSEDCPHRELDIEAALWGDPAADNLQFVVQPFDLPGHLHRFSSGTVAPTTHVLSWAPNRAHFLSQRGIETAASGPAEVLSEWELAGAGAVPAPADAAFHFNLWLSNGTPPTDGQSAEVVIRSFHFAPPPPTAAVLDFFQATPANSGGIRLVWQTLTEVDTLGFRVLRSVDGRVWSPLDEGLIPSRAEGQRPKLYETVDAAPSPAAGLKYRLVAIDLRGGERLLAEIPGPAAGPELALQIAQSGSTLRLDLTGPPGAVARFDAAASVTGVWAPFARVALDPQGRGSVAAAPLPSPEGARFYRAVIESLR